DFYSGKLACFNTHQFPDRAVGEAASKYVLRVTTKRPDPILPLRMSYVDVSDLKSQSLDVKITTPIGTGPYKFVSRAQGKEIKLTRFDGYWGKPAAAKDVTYVYRIEPSVRASMIQTGEAQVAIAIAKEDATKDGRTVAYK